MAIDLSKKKKVGFVCSGGVVKATAFHLGVASAIEQVGFRFLGGSWDEGADDPIWDPSRTIRVYVGSSAGSLVSTYLAQGGKLNDLAALFRQSGPDSLIPNLKYWQMVFPRLGSPKDLLSSDNFLFKMLKGQGIQSPFGTEGIIRFLREHVIKSDKFSELKPDLMIVTTEVNSLKKVIFGKYKSAPKDHFEEFRNDVSITDACAASMSLPPLYHPYTIQLDGMRRDFFDGEIREPLSSHVARDMDCDLVICSYTHQPLRLTPDKGSISDKGVFHVTLQAIYLVIEQKIQAARESRRREKKMIDAVRKFCKEKEIPESVIEGLIEEIEARTSYKSNVDYIYIHPRPTDSEMFLLPHFSLNKKNTEKVFKKGFLAAYSALRNLVPKSGI